MKTTDSLEKAKLLIQALDDNSVPYTDSYSEKNMLKNFIISINFAKMSLSFKKTPITLSSFVEYMLSTNDINEKEQIYFINGLVDLFSKIQNEFKLTKFIYLNSITDYLLLKYKTSNPLSYKLQSHNIKNINNDFINEQADMENLHFMSSVIINQPKVSNFNINLQSLKSNSKTFKAPVKFCVFNEVDNIFLIVLESIARIYLFTSECVSLKEVIPNSSLNYDKASIVSICYSSEKRKVISKVLSSL